MTASEIIANFKLSAHPEGDFYRRSYASKEVMEFNGLRRPVCTAIYFLLLAGQYSRLHRLPQDEMWHFYLGGPLRLVELKASGENHEVILGPDLVLGQRLQYLVPCGSWFGATPVAGSDFSLVGCTVAPGFCLEELELGRKELLQANFPKASQLIAEFCP